jgi:protein TonB
MLGFLFAPPTAPIRHVAPRPITVSIKPQPVREFVQPAVIPAHAIEIHDEPSPPAAAIGVVGDARSMNESISFFTPIETVAPPPPPPPAAVQSTPVPISGGVMAARLIYQVKPIYPALGIQVRVQGTVVLRAVISKEGTITNLAVISGHPLLIPAALDAVRQWRYQPTLLNNVPVEVETTIEVRFILGD